MIVKNMVLTHNPSCPVREIGDGLIIMAPHGETTHSLEEIGTFIWKEIDGCKDLASILEALLAQYDVDPATAETDLLQFVEEMIEAGLILAS